MSRHGTGDLASSSDLTAPIEFRPAMPPAVAVYPSLWRRIRDESLESWMISGRSVYLSTTFIRISGMLTGRDSQGQPLRKHARGLPAAATDRIECEQPNLRCITYNGSRCHSERPASSPADTKLLWHHQGLTVRPCCHSASRMNARSRCPSNAAGRVFFSAPPKTAYQMSHVASPLCVSFFPSLPDLPLGTCTANY